MEQTQQTASQAAVSEKVRRNDESLVIGPGKLLPRDTLSIIAICLTDLYGPPASCDLTYIMKLFGYI
eukprot:gene20933-biopygen1744